MAGHEKNMAVGYLLVQVDLSLEFGLVPSGSVDVADQTQCDGGVSDSVMGKNLVAKIPALTEKEGDRGCGPFYV